jgi:transcriptional regulator with XRE-family HTH domain
MLAELVKAKMKKENLSSRDVARLAGISHATVLRTVRGNICDLDTLLKLSDWLGIRPASVLNSLGPSTKTAEQIAVVLERFPALDSVFKQAIDKVHNENADLSIIDEIAAYVSFKLMLIE